MKENNLIIKHVEWIFAIVVLLVCILVLGKYVVLSATGHDISYNVERAIVKARNNSVATNGTQDNKAKNYTLNLIQGKWELLDGKSPSKEYQIVNQGGKVALKRNDEMETPPTALTIDGIGEYFTRESLIVTDIPYEATDVFSVSEQEDLFPVIGYHNVFERDDEIKDPFIDIRKADFEEQLKIYNSDLNCRWFGLTEVLSNYLLKGKKLPKNTCVMTFDDGRTNNYEIVLPVLKQHDVQATFFIIAGRIGQKSYMTNFEVSSLYRAGNEIGSHSFTGGSLVDTSWYPGTFTHETLVNQIQTSKEILSDYGYQASIFAYPLGEYDDTVLSVVKNAGYIGARATKKSNPWRDPRALATSMNDDFIWQLNYYQPELKFNDQIIESLSYSGWWQFEEGSRTFGETAYVLSTIKPTETSYGVVYLEAPLDSVENAFILENTGTYIIDILASNNAVEGTGFTIEVDGKVVQIDKDTSQNCIRVKSEQYCHYLVQTNMSEGKHILKITNGDGRTGLDKFQIKRLVPHKNSYGVKIEELL